MDPKVSAAGAIGAGIGALQTPLLREYVDRKYPTTNIPALKGFGYPGTFTGLITGGSALTVGVVGMTKDKTGRQRLQDIYVEPAIDYGVTALVGAVFSGLFPAVTAADCAAKGGFFYNGVCNKVPPPPGVTGMEGAPQVEVATRAYTPPASVQQPSVDMNVLRQMSAEIQRLAQENQQLRSSTMFVPGQPTQAAKHFGFMEKGREGIAPQHLEPRMQLAPRAMYVPGQPTAAAKHFGFMDDGSPPAAAVQQMKAKFDFSG